jgi:site-specific DNA recombinase
MLSLISSGSNKSISTSVYCAKVIIEKENIWTFDGKGEVMLTIMSSLAQDESRSISENIKWGMRKSFADGKVTVPYSNLLGFDKGPDGVLAINEKEARIVRWIFSRCLMEYPPGYIAKRLREMGVPNVHGNSEWSKQTVRCILRNKKHVGGCHPPEDLFPGFPDKETDSEQRPAPQVLCEE